MSKRRKWLMLLACLVAAIALLLLLTHEREPSYQGRSLSAWLESYASELESPPSDRKAEAAIRHIGTNALPLFCQWLDYESPRWGIRNQVRFLLRKVPPGFRPGPLDRWANSSDWKEERALAAGAAFALIGEREQLIIPLLTALMNDPSRPRTAQRATRAAAFLGNDARPLLLAHLADTNANGLDRVTAIFAFGRISVFATNADCVALLVRCLEDANPDVSRFAAISLGAIARFHPPQAAMIVTALSGCLRNDSRWLVRRCAAQSLGAYGDQAREAVPLLLPLTTDPDARFHSIAINALQTIAPRVLTNSLPP